MTTVKSTQPPLQHFLCIGLEVLQLLTPLQMRFLCEFQLKNNVAQDPQYQYCSDCHLRLHTNFFLVLMTLTANSHLLHTLAKLYVENKPMMPST